MSKRLNPGTIAPEFGCELWDESSFNLKLQRGKTTSLAFFRYASCPLCNLRVHDMIRQNDTFKKFGLEVVTVFQSPKESISEYVGRQKQADFLDNPDGTIHTAFYGDKIGDHIPFELVMQFAVGGKES